MKHIFFAACLLVAGTIAVRAQDTAANRALTMAEYDKAKSFSVADLDKDTYVKVENTYILDRGGFGKPYFITGDDGMKKRIDLYKLILKEGRIELGTVIYYTTEKGKRYTACMPGYRADGKVWEKYFEDIHAIDKEEKFYVRMYCPRNWVFNCTGHLREAPGRPSAGKPVPMVTIFVFRETCR
jgi:hypothetical protein